MSHDQYLKPMDAFRRMINHPYLKDRLLDCFWPPNFKSICLLFYPKQIKIKLGWETLNKYFPRFPNSRFVLYTDRWDNSETVCLTLVDKVKLLEVVRQHIDDFQPVLTQHAMQLEDLLDNEKLDSFLINLHHDGLYGTLLGFGRDNAWLYWKSREKYPEEWPMVSAWPEEEIVNLEQLNKKTLSFESWDLSDLFYPRFACDPQSEETKQLKQTYRKERENIIKYYEGKDLVEANLSLLNQKLNNGL